MRAVVTDQLRSDLASLRIDRSSPVSSNGSSRGSGSGSGGRAVRNVVVTLLALGALGAAGVFAFGKVQNQIFKQEMKTTEVLTLSPSQAEVQVTATGYVIPQLTSKVGSKLPGRLASVSVKEGDTVKAGQIIAQLEDADARTQVAAASSRVGAASARIGTAEANLADITQQVERERALVASGTVGKATLDTLLARQKAATEAVKAARAEVGVARAEVGTVDVGLKDRLIVTPISGRVVTKPATVGEFVGGFGNVAPIAEIVDFSSLMVEVDVPEARLHLVKLGGPAEIVLDAYPNKRYRGVATELGQRVNRAKATVVVKVKFMDDLEGVLPEMSARVSFLAKAITDEALREKPKKIVAKDAIVTRDGRSIVFAVEDGKLHAVPVKTGDAVGSGVELIDGPTSGTKVVAAPGPEAFDGQRIKESDGK